MAYVQPLSEPIAIVGRSCRYSGAVTTPSKLWDLIRAPVDLSRKAPSQRWNVDAFYHEDGEHQGTTNAPKAYFLEQDVRGWDASFFNTTPKEAEAIDPQARLLLEVVYEGMESAGLTLQGCAGSKTGVFVGVMTADFESLTFKDDLTSSSYAATGTHRALISNRVSYFFNWNGPSMTIDTACSASLVALHQAVLSLRTGECSLACVAGTNLLLSPDLFVAQATVHMLSPQGTSKMWDESADGYARGEGLGCFILKPLSRALADGDEVRCLIRETGVNSDGRTTGITMPSPEAQAMLIRDTYQRTGLDPRNPAHRCQYFEAHGTGTQAGDPREAEAIHTAFFGTLDEDKDRDDSYGELIVGSIKTIVGHTEGAAGVAGVLKACLALENQQIPPNQFYRTPNPKVAPFTRRLKVPTALAPWPTVPAGQPLRASINSFGFGGTNAHCIVERYDPAIHGTGTPTPARNPSGALLPVMLSAKSEGTLTQMVRNLRDHLEHLDAAAMSAGEEDSKADLMLHDMAQTLTFHRSVLAHKVAFAAPTSIADLVKQMTTSLDGNLPTATATTAGADAAPTRILGIFTGQGAQWATMGKALIEKIPAFKNTLQTLDSILQSVPSPQDRPSWSIISSLLAPAASSRLDEAALSQPLCTALQIALVDLLASAGVTLSAVVGHSSGEIGAAYASGSLSARDAILIAYYRGVHAKLARGASGERGGMMAVGMSVDEALSFCSQEGLRGRLYIAACNAPASVTLSGDLEAVQIGKALLDREKRFCRPLRVDTAYHSHHMDACAEPYLASLAAVGVTAKLPSPSMPWVSSVYGPVGAPTAAELAGPYWRDNMVQPVMFSQALTRVIAEHGPFDAVLEVGPHPALKGPATQTMQEVAGKGGKKGGGDKTTGPLPYSGVLARNKNDVSAFSEALGMLWSTSSSAVDFTAFATASGPNSSHGLIKDLPHYPWDHSQNHFRLPRTMRQYLQRSDKPHVLLGVRSADEPGRTELRWRNIIKPSAIPWLKDHKFQGQVIVPVAAYGVMALEAARTLAAVGIAAGEKVAKIEVHDLEIQNGITMAADDQQGMETLFALNIENTEGSSTANGSGSSRNLTARWSLSFAPPLSESNMRLAVSGRILVELVATNDRQFLQDGGSALPPRAEGAMKQELNKVDVDDFYSSMHETGLQYSGAFRGLSGLRRRMGFASGRLDELAEDVLLEEDYTDLATFPVHPALLDSCCQALFVAFAAPFDGALWTSFLPKRIRLFRFNADLAPPRSGSQSDSDVAWPKLVSVEASVSRFDPTSATTQAGFTGDIDIFDAQGRMQVQVEGVTLQSFMASNENDDREFYLHSVLRRDPWTGFDVHVQQSENAVEDENDEEEEEETDKDLVALCDRIAKAYAPQPPAPKSRAVSRQPSFTSLRRQPSHPTLRRQASHSSLSGGGNDLAVAIKPKLAAIADAESQQSAERKELDSLISASPYRHHLELLRACGERVPALVPGLAQEIVQQSAETSRFVRHVRSIVENISHRHPQIAVLEVDLGGSSGAVALTKGVAGALARSFISYTRASSAQTALAEGAVAAAFKSDSHKFAAVELPTGVADDLRSALEVVAAAQSQPFDVVVISDSNNHSTAISKEDGKASVAELLQRLLKPGGFLLDVRVPAQHLRDSLFGFLNPRQQALAKITDVDADVETDRTSATFFGDMELLHQYSIARESDDASSNNLSLTVSQAKSSEIDLLRAPRSFPAETAARLSGTVLIVGGTSPETATMRDHLIKVLSACAPSCEVLQSPTFAELSSPTSVIASPAVVESLTGVIVLADLDAVPVLKDMTTATFKGLQAVFALKRHVMWLTRGYIRGVNGGQPWHAASVGLGRTLRAETPELTMQFVDIETSLIDDDDDDDEANVNVPDFVADTYLRLALAVASNQKKDGKDGSKPKQAAAAAAKSSSSSLLWSTELEIILTSDGKTLLPRVLPVHEANARLNSIRRVITREADTEAEAVELVAHEERPGEEPGYRVRSLGKPEVLFPVPDDDEDEDEDDEVILHVLASSVWSVYVPGTEEEDHSVFVGVGETFVSAPSSSSSKQQRRKFLFVSPTNASWISVPKAWTAPLVLDAESSEAGRISNAEIAGIALRAFVAQRIVSDMSKSKKNKNKNGTWAILGADASFASVMNQLLGEQRGGMTKGCCYPTTDRELASKDSRFVYVHALASDRAARAALPSQIEAVVDLNGNDHTSPLLPLVERLRLAAPAPLTVGFSQTASTRDTLAAFDGAIIRSALEVAKGLVATAVSAPAPVSRHHHNHHARSASLSSTPTTTGIEPLSALVSASGFKTFLATVDWTKETRVAERVQDIDPATVLHGDKTYVLVGLTGDLGESLCRFMASHGARHFVVASRNPGKAQRWADDIMATAGVVPGTVVVRLERLNVIDIQAVRDLKSRLRDDPDLPPVGGMVNGAMLLEDGLFADMTLDKFNKVLLPKTVGSQNLSDVFDEPDLDFFVMFSSLTCLGGNSGQSNYTAANLFMAGLAAQRRRRGLAACSLDIGIVYGIGYVNRVDGASIYRNLRKQGYLPIAEPDIHHMFIEAIVAGRAGAESADFSEDKESAAAAATGGDAVVGQLSLGVQRWDPNAETRLAWTADPRFSHHIALDTDGAGGSGAGAGKDGASAGAAHQNIKEVLRTRDTVDSITDALLEAFASKLESMLHLAPGSVNKSVPVVDLGVDSLVAVEIRSWFLKDVGKDMPVLKVLGGSSPATLCSELAVEIVNDRAAAAAGGDDSKAEAAGKDDQQFLAQSGEVSDDALFDMDQLVGDDEDENDGAVVFEQISSMSFSQSRMWIPYLLLQDKTTYNCTTSYRLKGRLDVARYEAALQAVVRKHRVFRTRFYTDDVLGETMQAVATTSTFKLNKPSRICNDTTDVEAEATRIANHAFDLEAGDVFIATLLTHDAADYHSIVFGYHHIILDGFSWQHFLDEVERFYVQPTRPRGLASDFVDFAVKQRAELNGPAVLAKRAFWKEYLLANNGSASSSSSSASSAMPLLPFARVARRATGALQKGYRTTEYFRELDRGLVKRIRAAATEHRSTTFHFHLAVLQTMLHRLLGLPEVCIGIVDANRSDPAFMNTIGLMLDSLPLRFRFGNTGGDKETFGERLQTTRTAVYEALGNSGVPLDVMLSDSGVEASADHHPLFQALLNFRMGGVRQKALGSDVTVDVVAYRDASHPFDFVLTVDEDDSREDEEGDADARSFLTLSMQDYLYDKGAAHVFLDTYVHLLEAFSTNSATTALEQPDAFPASSIQKAVELGKGKKKPLADPATWPGTLPARIEDMASRFPDNVALRDDNGANNDVSLRYSELSARVNAFASALVERGAAKETRVGVLGGPSASSVLALLAILRAGACYVPLDERNSDERLAAIVAQAGVSIIVHGGSTDAKKRLPVVSASATSSSSSSTLDISTFLQPSFTSSKKSKLPPLPLPSDLAMIMFTSGSTGRPKGIKLTHGNFHAHIKAASAGMTLRPGRESVLHQSALGYDASLAQIFYALANGGKVVVASNRGEMEAMAARMVKEQVTLTLMAPSEYALLFALGGGGKGGVLGQCKSWKVAMCGGEAFVPGLRRGFRDLGIEGLKVVNAYGPTEISVASNIGEVAYRDPAVDAATDAEISIGPVLPGYQVCLVDENAQPVPQGCLGQMAVSGAAVSAGYLDNEALTREKFRSLTINSNNNNSNGRWYLTGDMARMDAEGRFFYKGRIDGDSMIKLRGIRIELDDVRNAIMDAAQGRLSQAVVTARGDGENQFLVAHVVFSSLSAGRISNVDAYLADLIARLPLPVYMRPARAIALDSLPLNASGKVDIKAVKAMALPGTLSTSSSIQEGLWKPLGATAQQQQQPRRQTQTRAHGHSHGHGGHATATEQRLINEIWPAVLGNSATGIHITGKSNFFAAGGNSLLLLRLQAAIRNAFGGVSIGLPELFRIDTLGEMARKIDESLTSSSSSPALVVPQPAVDSDSMLSSASSVASGDEVMTTGTAVSSASEDAGTAESIDWAAETELPAWARDFAASLSLSSRRGGDSDYSSRSVSRRRHAAQAARNNNGISGAKSAESAKTLSIILTGATGFLGRAVARALQDSPAVSQIHCLAVRSPFGAAARRLARDCPKAVLYQGDLQLPRLGLGEDEARLVFGDADAVIHNGADVSFLKTYSALRAANVSSTLELARMCAELANPGIGFHFVSTAGVLGVLDAGLESAPLEPASVVRTGRKPDHPAKHDGYVSSKWASEALVEKLAERGVLRGPVRVYRPSNITGDEAPDLDITHNVMAFSRRMGAVPDMRAAGWKGSFDFIAVDTAAKKVAHDVLLSMSREGVRDRQHLLPGAGGRKKEKETVQFVHVSGEQVMKIEEAREQLELESGGRPVRMLPFAEWIEEAKQHGLSELVAAYLGMITTGAGGELVRLPRLVSSL